MKIPKRIAFPLAIVLVGAAVMAAMILFKPKAERVRPARLAPAVNTVQARFRSARATVLASGLVTSSQRISVVPQVGGKVTFLSKNLMPGGRFASGEVLARIDAREYRLAALQEESRVRQAELDFQLEQGRQSIARQEWELLGDSRPEEQASLALRKPHLAAAQENLKAAQSGLGKAQLNLNRTSFRAPFNAMVLEENVDLGQVVSPGMSIATLIGTDRFWVRASVPVEKLALLEIPGFNAETGSTVTLLQNLGDSQPAQRSGTVLGLAGGLDTQTRSAVLLIGVDHPMDPPEGRKPLLHGAFVDLQIAGREMEGVVLVPQGAVVDGNSVWLAGADNRLERRLVTIGWSDARHVAVTHGLSEQDRIVVTPFARPVKGMLITPKQPETENNDADANEDPHGES